MCIQQVTLLPEVSEKTRNIVMLRMTSLFKIASLTLSQASVNKKRTDNRNFFLISSTGLKHEKKKIPRSPQIKRYFKHVFQHSVYGQLRHFLGYQVYLNPSPATGFFLQAHALSAWIQLGDQVPKFTVVAGKVSAGKQNCQDYWKKLTSLKLIISMLQI